MITKSRVTGEMVLDIFENFREDHNLPKFKTPGPEKTQYAVITSSSGSILSGTSTNMFFSNDTGSFVNSSGFVIIGQNTVSEEPPQKKKRFAWLRNLFTKKKTNVIKVFAQIFENLDQIKEFDKREDYINASLRIAEQNGQTALVEKIKHIKLIHSLESQLIALGFIKVITEEQLVKFAYDCEHGLRLDWIKNFTRNIPADVIEKKNRADRLKLFENYVILHYDPENKSNQLTREEIEKKKDPILFGVFKDSRKLYYIGDWVDEYCNLTFDDLVAKIGEENLKLKQVDENLPQPVKEVH